jgi:hypothetical protein
MLSKRARGIAKKSERRKWVVDQIMATLSDDRIFTTLDYRRKSESYLKQYMHQPLQARMITICKTMFPGVSDRTIEKKAKLSLFWEGDVRTTVNNIRFLGVQHRPDFVVKVDDIRVAVEVKRGENGSAVREGLGQSLVYSSCEDFDFVVYLFVDTSRDKKIRDSLNRSLDSTFIQSLWDERNIRFAIV